MADELAKQALALCERAKEFRDACNMLWWAQNPDETPPCGEARKCLSVDEAQERHGDAFQALASAEYYTRKAVRRASNADTNGK